MLCPQVAELSLMTKTCKKWQVFKPFKLSLWQGYTTLGTSSDLLMSFGPLMIACGLSWSNICACPQVYGRAGWDATR